jgi:hypothetical protein
MILKTKLAMLKERVIPDSRTPYKYMVVINNGIDWRLFKDFDTMCTLMGLDPKILTNHFKKRGSYTGFDFTLFRVQEENAIRNRGFHY